jgi:acetyl-CoA carboxylase biotin carboxyl carrier protein
VDLEPAQKTEDLETEELGARAKRMKPEGPAGMEELKELIAFLKDNEIAEFDLERGDLKVSLKFASAITPVGPSTGSGLDLASLARLMSLQASAAPVAHAPAGSPVAHTPAAPAAPAAEPENLHIIKSPIVGTFYESPSPGSSAFVTNGDRIEKGQVVCIVEAMKLMNEIEADATGEIVKRLVNNGQPVEYGQPLFAIRTT